MDDQRRNALANMLLGQPPAASPMQGNILSRLAMVPPNPIADLPAAPARDVLTATPRHNQTGQEMLTEQRRNILAEMLDPGSSFNRYGMGFMGPAVMGAVRPIRAYHGATTDFDVFDFSRLGSGATDGRWVNPDLPPSAYLTTSPGHASFYGDPLAFDVRGRLLSFDARGELARWARENGHRGAQRMIDDYGGDFYGALNADNYFVDAIRRATREGYDGARIRTGDLVDRAHSGRGVPVGDILIIGRPDIATRVR